MNDPESALRRHALVRRPAPPDLVERVMRRVDGERAPTLAREIVRLAAAAAVLLAILVGGSGQVASGPVLDRIQADAREAGRYVMEELPDTVMAVWRGSHE
jgi:hypothetical protein